MWILFVNSLKSVLSSSKNCYSSSSTSSGDGRVVTVTVSIAQLLKCQWQRFNDRNKQHCRIYYYERQKVFTALMLLTRSSTSFPLAMRKHLAQNVLYACDKFLTLFCLSYFHSFMHVNKLLCTLADISKQMKTLPK